MTFPIHINRPHYRSFSFENTIHEPSLEQINKLARNFIASLDLGCPNARHVRIVRPKSNNDHDTHNLTEHERYLLWVRQWKEIYASLSILIRILKQRRRSVRPIPPLTEREQLTLTNLCDASNSSGRTILNDISRRNLPRLQETAQALLNARFNAKLASRALRAQRLSTHLKPSTLSDEEFKRHFLSPPGGIVLNDDSVLAEMVLEDERSREDLVREGKLEA